MLLLHIKGALVTETWKISTIYNNTRRYKQKACIIIIY